MFYIHVFDHFFAIHYCSFKLHCHFNHDVWFFYHSTEFIEKIDLILTYLNGAEIVDEERDSIQRINMIQNQNFILDFILNNIVLVKSI